MKSATAQRLQFAEVIATDERGVVLKSFGVANPPSAFFRFRYSSVLLVAYQADVKSWLGFQVTARNLTFPIFLHQSLSCLYGAKSSIVTIASIKYFVLNHLL